MGPSSFASGDETISEEEGKSTIVRVLLAFGPVSQDRFHAVDAVLSRVGRAPSKSHPEPVRHPNRWGLRRAQSGRFRV